MMPKQDVSAEYDQLQALLRLEAMKSGDCVEVDNRRSTGVVGISVYSKTVGKYHSMQIDWVNELDGMEFPEALAVAKRYIALHGSANDSSEYVVSDQPKNT